MKKETAMKKLQALPHLKDIPNSGPRSLSPDQFAKRQELVEIVESATRDASWIVERNRLIPSAAAYADASISPKERAAWAAVFLRRMDELHAELRRKIRVC